MHQQFLSFTIKKKSDASTSTRHKNKQCHLSLSCVCRVHQDCCLQHKLFFTKAKIYPVQAWLSICHLSIFLLLQFVLLNFKTALCLSVSVCVLPPSVSQNPERTLGVRLMNFPIFSALFPRFFRKFS